MLLNSGLKGFSQSSMVYDGNMNNWIIIDKQFSGPGKVLNGSFNVLGHLAHTRFPIPTGLQQWKINDKTCNETRLLKLSSVSKLVKKSSFTIQIVNSILIVQ